MSTHPWPPRRWVAPLLAAALLLAGCSADSGSDAAEQPAATPRVACDAEPEVLATDDGLEFVRTPDSCFEDLPDWPYEAQYVEIDGLRQAYVDEGPADGEVVLLLHGQPSWSYLYRHMIPVFVDAGYRVVAMDHLGMGGSDKPIEVDAYSYLGHNQRLQRFMEDLDLTDINLFAQDWGSLIGLRTAGLDTDRYATITIGDGALPELPDGLELIPPVDDPDQVVELESPFVDFPAQQPPFYDGCEPIAGNSEGDGEVSFGDWATYAMTGEGFRPSDVLEALTWFDLPDEVEAAYDAPYPDRAYLAGPRTFPSLINDVPGTTAEAWEGLRAFDKPFLTLWAANDPGNLGQCASQQLLIDEVPGAAGQPHDRLAEASHFLQDDQGQQIAERMVDWLGGLGGAAGPSYGTYDDGLAAEMAQSDDTEPFFMLNLIEFRDRAVYADGRATDLTGREANDVYAATGVQRLLEGGMRPALSASVSDDQPRPPEPAWEQVAIARYPNYADFFALTGDPAFQEGVEHKDAGVETSSVIVTKRIDDPPAAAELPAATDPVVLFDLYSHGGTGTADRPDSLTAYLDAVAPASRSQGGIALGTYEVVGTLVGDGRTWDEAHLWWFPDRAQAEAVLGDAELADLAAARDGDLDDHYRLVLDEVSVEPVGREP